jgi:hypothetical protein
MPRPRRIFLLLPFVVLPIFAGSWSGVLVDADCYAREERNVDPKNTTFDVDRDRDLEIRYCLPSPKTKSFAVVQFSGQSFKLDSAGNAKAAEIVPKTTKKSRIHVTVTGQMVKNVVSVDSIIAGLRTP